MTEEKFNDNIIPWLTLILLVVLIYMVSGYYKSPDINVNNEQFEYKIYINKSLEEKLYDDNNTYKDDNVNKSERIYHPGDVTYPNGSDYPGIFHQGDIILSNGTIIKKGERIP